MGTQAESAHPDVARGLTKAGLILAVDQGTTNTKALVMNSSGAVIARGSQPVGIAFPTAGWVEQQAVEIWAATSAAIDECLSQVSGSTPVAVAVSNQRESVLAWSRTTGEPLGPVLGWQDARTAEWCRALGATAAAEVRRRTGLSLDAMYSAPKMRWLLDAAVAHGVDPSDVCLGTVDAWLVWKLTGHFATEAGNASRTLLFDLHELRWNPDLLALFGIPNSALPEVRASDAGFGSTVGIGLLPAGVPVVAVLADSHAALYRHGCERPGTGKATFGTGSSVMARVATPDAAPTGIGTTLAWLTGAPTYAREGNIVATGSALDWMARTLGGDGSAGGAYLTELAAQVPDAGGVAFVPAFSGLGAPYWDRGAIGLLAGVTGGTTRSHLARAALDAVAHQVADVVEAMESDGQVQIDLLEADGGATASSLLMQIQADVLGRSVRVADAREASALGVALLAARTLGWVLPAEEDENHGFTVLPVLPPAARAARREAWADAVRRCLSSPGR